MTFMYNPSGWGGGGGTLQSFEINICYTSNLCIKNSIQVDCEVY
mgnify:CR=1 FL=1